MAKTLLFIFLLDHLPENTLNKTLHTVFNNTNSHLTQIEECKPMLTDPLLETISTKQLKFLMISNDTSEGRDVFKEPSLSSSDKSEEINEDESSRETDHSSLVDSSDYYDYNEELDEEGNSNVDYTDFLTAYEDLHSNERLSKVKKSRNKKDSKKKLINTKINKTSTSHVEEIKALHPKFEPASVAVFESVGNVTAQTCGGTLLTSQWLLVPATCLNMLDNSTNITNTSIYTIIVNARNPLYDGTAHNVTEIRLPPEHTDYNIDDVNDSQENFKRSYNNHENRENVTSVTVTNSENQTAANIGNEINGTDVPLTDKADTAQNSDQNNNNSDPKAVQTPSKIEANTSNPEIVKSLSMKANPSDVVHTTSTIATSDHEVENTITNISNPEVAYVPSTNTREYIILQVPSARTSIALMKLDPPVQDMKPLKIVSVTNGQPVLAYAWVMIKDESNVEVMRPMAFGADLLSPMECVVHYNIPADMMEDELCLASRDINVALSLRANWGGPVMTSSGGLAALSRGDGSAPCAATLLGQHSAWIQTVVGDYHLTDNINVTAVTLSSDTHEQTFNGTL